MNRCNASAIHFACYGGDPEVVRVLLEAGADVNQVCREPEVHCESPINRTIQYSTVHDNKLLMQLMPLLLAGKVDLYNSKPYPALEYAIRDMALPSVIELLLMGGCDPNYPTEDGTALHTYLKRSMG